MSERAPEYAYCESTYASIRSRVHIRVVGAEGLKLGGGALDTTLCGDRLNGGWDLETPVTAGYVQRELESPAEINPQCRECGEELLRRTGQAATDDSCL